MGEEAIRCHTEVRHKLDQEYVSRGDEGSGQETTWNVQSSQSEMTLKGKFFFCHLLWGLVAAVFSDEAGIVFLATIKECHIVKATICVSFQEELIELHLDDLVPKQKHDAK